MKGLFSNPSYPSPINYQPFFRTVFEEYFTTEALRTREKQFLVFVFMLFLSLFSLGEKIFSSGREKNLIAVRKDSHWEEKKFSLW